MAGYSGTPLPKKLGIKENFRVLLEAMPREVRADLQDSLSACELVKQPRGPIHFIMLFVKKRSELQQRIAVLARQLAPAGSPLSPDDIENDAAVVGGARLLRRAATDHRLRPGLYTHPMCKLRCGAACPTEAPHKPGTPVSCECHGSATHGC